MPVDMGTGISVGVAMVEWVLTTVRLLALGGCSLAASGRERLAQVRLKKGFSTGFQYLAGNGH